VRALCRSCAPLCGKNLPHVQHWTLTTRTIPLLELLPVTPDSRPSAPSRGPRLQKITRYLEIRNSYSHGSSHPSDVLSLLVAATSTLNSARNPHTHRNHPPRHDRLRHVRAGASWDNALAESFFSSLKGELIDTRAWRPGPGPGGRWWSTSPGTTAPGCTPHSATAALPTTKKPPRK
jgi:hypothetical protein